MFAKLKKSANEALQQGKDKIKQVQDEYKEKQQTGWRKEVVLQDNTFKTSQQWFEIYEPKAKKESSANNMVQEKINQIMLDQLTINIVKTVMECMSLATEAAEQEVKAVDEKLYVLLNGITSLFLTYRFEYKNKKKFKYFRGLSIDKIALTLIEILDREASLLGKDPLQLSEEDLEKIVSKMCDILYGAIEKKKELSIQQFKDSTLFSIAALNNGDEIDDIVKTVIDLVQTYGEKKMEQSLSEIKAFLPQFFNLFYQNQGQIRQNLAYMVKYKENSPQYDGETKEKILFEIDTKYFHLRGFIYQFLQRFSGIIVQNGGANKVDKADEQ